MNGFSNDAYYLFFSTLANRTRLAIVDALIDGPKSASEISKILEHDQGDIDDNLKQLEKCVLLTSESRGKERVYTLNLEIMEPISEAIEFHTAKHCPGLRECIPQDKLRKYMKREAAKVTFIEHE